MTFFNVQDMKPIASKYYLYTAGGCLLLTLSLLYYYFFSTCSVSNETVYLYIDDDDTADSVITKLRPVASTHSVAGFSALVRHSGYAENIRSGRYAVNPGEGTFRIFRKLKNGQQTPLSLTIPEARTVDRLAGILSRKLMTDSTTIAKALTDPVFCARYGYDTLTVMTVFIPNTYSVYWNLSIDRLMERMKKEHDVFWNMERKRKAKTMNLTETEVATLASIIDEETANNSEKPMIAGMYYNRLKIDMPLQADPTIKFALKNFGLRRIYNKLLHIDSPYNTYKNTGLPPGPIKIASIAGIDAVLNYAKHDYLYMCAKEDFSGTHNFAATYETHLQNAARYSEALNKRGIK